MLSGPTCRASETAGTAVLRIVVSSDSMKKATATSHGSSFLAAAEGDGTPVASTTEVASVVSVTGLVMPHCIEGTKNEDRDADGDGVHLKQAPGNAPSHSVSTRTSQLNRSRSVRGSSGSQSAPKAHPAGLCLSGQP